jgi:erythromycin esterase-like protein
MIEGSYEALFHQTRIPAFFLPLHDSKVRRALGGSLLERAIGVIYLPQSERVSHHFKCQLPGQFDAVIHIDRRSTGDVSVCRVRSVTVAKLHWET